MGYGAGASPTYFDLDNDGFAERTGWVAGGDGLLAIDSNSNGKIDNQSELFGNSATHADGFAALRTLDSNSDNKITSADTAWSSLKVWVDADNDGITDTGELHSLASLNITQIGLNSTPQSNVYNNENPVTATSTFVIGGVTRAVADVWFRNDQMDTRYLGDVTLIEEVFYLPTLKGFGKLKDLHVAMSQDSTLLGMVEDLVTGWSAANFLNPAALDQDIKDILFRWAGVESVSTTSRGAYVDGQALAFMEVLTGSPYGGIAGTNPVAIGAGNAVTESYRIAFDALKAQLVVQAGGYSLFSEAPIYNVVSGELTNGAISASSISVLQTQASGAADKAVYWAAVGAFLLNVKSPNEFSSVETTALNSAIQATDSSLSWSSVVASVLSRYPSLSVDGTAFADFLVGTANSAEVFQGFGGDDILKGGAGNDALYGGLGSDTYVFGAGFSTPGSYDYITENIGEGTNDKIVFEGLTSAQVYSWHDYNYMYFGLADGSTIRFYDSLQSTGVRMNQMIETIVFTDTTWNTTTGLTLNDSNDDHTLYGSALGDTLNGNGGSDALYGYDGDDILKGGAGNDSLQGGLGNDTYVFGAGFSTPGYYDYITENLAEGTSDKIVFEGLTSSQVYNWHDANYMYFGLADGSTIRFYDSLQSTGVRMNQMIETIVFTDTTWNTTTGLTLNDSNDDHTLYGSALGDTLNGNGGSDALYGYDGDDILKGGAGNDSLQGGLGNDTYVFGAGFSTPGYYDYITENLAEGTSDKIVFEGLTSSQVYNWHDANYMYFGLADGSTVRIYDSVQPTGARMNQMIETIVFTDTTWNTTTGLIMNDNSDAHYLNGSALGDTLKGNGGGDNLYGYDGNDTLNGGADNDYLYGGTGSDTYVFGAGFSTSGSYDYITENIAEGTNDKIIFEGLTSAQVYSWHDGNYMYFGLADGSAVRIYDTVQTTGARMNEMIETIVFTDTTWNYTTGLILNDSNDAHTLYGSALGDALNGNGGNDTLNGYDGDDSLIGGAGNDYLNGGLGNDTYVFAAGFSPSGSYDYITENIGEGTSDKIIFEGLSSAQVHSWHDGSYMYFRLADGSAVRIYDTVQPTGVRMNQMIESIVFTDTTWNYATGLILNDSNDDHSLYGSALGDTLNGNGGADTLDGYDGDDSLNGGAGNDSLQGGNGNDTYLFNTGFGNDTITDTSGTDKIQFGTGITLASLRFWVSGNDLYIYSGSDRIILGQHFYDRNNSTTSYGEIEQIVFSDTSTFNLSGDFTFTGTASADSISGTAGHDTLVGLEGIDTLDGGVGNDTLDGGNGNDSLQGGSGNDTYLFNTGFGNDTITDTSGTDKIQFGTGITLASLRFWVSGNDLYIYSGSDRIILGQHFYDRSNGTTSYDEVEQILFSDTSTFSLSGNFTFTGTASAEVVYGTAGHDTLVGLAGNDTLDGGAGDDTYFFNTGFGNDSISDTSGTDKIQFGTGITLASLRFWVSGNDLYIYSGSDRIILGQHFYDRSNGTTSYNEVEQILFSDTSTFSLSGNFTFTGTASAEVVYGTAGHDTLVGLAGNDTLDGGAGDDTYFFNTGFGNDSISDTSGTDKIQFGTGITLASLRFWVSGNDLYIYSGSDRLVLGQHFYDRINGTNSYDEIEQIVFSDASTFSLSGNFTFTGTASADSIVGTTGHDTLVGLGGNDNLYGYAGNDTYFFDTGFGLDTVSDTSGNDIIRLGAGITTENISLADYSTWDTRITLTAGTHEITITNQRNTGTTDSIETLQFSDGFKANLLTYSTWVWGTSSAQTTTGTANADTIFGRGGNDTINGNAGNDAIHGGSGTDTITGGDGDDVLHGGIGNDNLNGGNNNDILYGGDGLDTLTGGSGADTYVFTSDSAFNNIDIISGFSTAQADKINLADLLQQYDPLTEAITDFVQITTSGSNSLLKVDIDGGGNSFVQIAQISGVTGLTDEAALVSSGNLLVS
ncbi:beta strand repeat-containing protein [Sinorhizobium medicae]